MSIIDTMLAKVVHQNPGLFKKTFVTASEYLRTLDEKEEFAKQVVTLDAKVFRLMCLMVCAYVVFIKETKS